MGLSVAPEYDGSWLHAGGFMVYFNVGVKEDDTPVRIKALNLVWFLQDPLYLVERGFSGDLCSLGIPPRHRKVIQTPHKSTRNYKAAARGIPLGG